MAGDMFLGACLDLGLPLTRIAEVVAALDLGVTVEQRAARRAGLAGTRFRVLLDGRPLEGPDPEEAAAGGAAAAPASAAGDRWSVARLGAVLGRLQLPAGVGARAHRLLDRLAAAEVAASGRSANELSWSQPAALDLLVDLVGAVVAVSWLEPRRISCSTVQVGGGAGPVGAAVQGAGRRPLPGATTARLLTGIPVAGGEGGELVTPTGAVLLAGLVDEFGPLPPMRVEACGYGLGRAELPDRPNAVRLWLGHAEKPVPTVPTGSP